MYISWSKIHALCFKPVLQRPKAPNAQTMPVHTTLLSYAGTYRRLSYAGTYHFAMLCRYIPLCFAAPSAAPADPIYSYTPLV